MTRFQVCLILASVGWMAILAVALAWLRAAATAGERFDQTITDHHAATVPETMRRCLFGSCSKPAKWLGVSPSTLAHNETYPTYACDEHVIGLVAVRDLDGNYRAGDERILADLDIGDQP